MTPELDLNEANTRAEFIEEHLREAHWGERHTPRSRIDREHVISIGKLLGGGQRASTRPADFVLLYKGHKLAVIEAKRIRRHATEGVQQAKDYAALLKVRFAYATNGKQIYRIHRARNLCRTLPNPRRAVARHFCPAKRLARPFQHRTL